MKKYILLSVLPLLLLMLNCNVANAYQLTIVVSDKHSHKVELIKNGQIIYVDWTLNGVLVLDNIIPDNYTVVIDDGKYVQKITPNDTVVLFNIGNIPLDEKDLMLIIIMVIALISIFVILTRK